MTPDEILQRLRKPQPLPRAALRACAEQPNAVIPRIAEFMERAADPDRGVASEDESIVFFGVFVLAETGDTRAYRSLLAFLSGDAETVDRLLRRCVDRDAVPGADPGRRRSGAAAGAGV